MATIKIPTFSTSGLKKSFAKFDTKKAAIILAAAGAVCLAISSFFPDKNAGVFSDTSAFSASSAVSSNLSGEDFLQADVISAYSRELEQRLAHIVSGMTGTGGNADVMITLESTFESVYAYNAEVGNTSFSSVQPDRSSEKQLVLTQNSHSGGKESPVLVKKVYPKVKGVVVVCPGGGSERVKCEVTDAACALFGIASSRVEVYGSQNYS